ncbi:ABC transporter permease [Dactylosporangium sp. CA-092794]|uniref:ABC transporter permease n=1 Tax=Dactylosporangium sp. CA-092794 TaxID=3239929 RepID=UPI003D8E1359
MTAGQPPAARLRPSRLRPGDVLRVGSSGLRTRRTRVVLSALGIAIGIAAMISVVGISASSRADLERQLAALGTNTLTATPTPSANTATPRFPPTAVPMVARIEAVESVSAVGRLPEVGVYRNEHILAAETNAITAYAADLSLADTLRITVTSGHWLAEPGNQFPTVVLGVDAAQRLGFDEVTGNTNVVIGDRRFTVVGILGQVPLAPELDSAALVGWPVAEQVFGLDSAPTSVYTRVRPDMVLQVRALLARTIDPAAPSSVNVTRPSDALTAKAITDRTFQSLMLGLGAVALLVGGIGVANTMVISVLERRAEIGLRRALGATRGQIRLQFLAESLLLSAIGGIAGVLLGIIATSGYAFSQRWITVVPLWATAGGLAATVVVGAMAGLYPAVRAARMTPTQALAAT